ncbi:MAG TPA: hypothetical protein VGJ35_09880 [Burkholderiaceae bacterium]|jgi:hypothetical protein
MKRLIVRPPKHLLAPGERLAVALAALTASGGIVAALILTFLGASPAEWLVPESDLSERLAQCEPISERQAREQCKQDVLTARLEANKRPVVVTQH